MALSTQIEQVATSVEDLLVTNKNALGFSKVEFSEITTGVNISWPACLIIPGETAKDPEASGRQVELRFQMLVYVLHAKMTPNRAARTHKDLQLVAEVETLLESDMTFGGTLAGSWVQRITPRTVPLRANLNVIGSELSWIGISRGRIGS